MKRFIAVALALVLSFNVQAKEIDGTQLNLTAEQNQKLKELKDDLNAEVQPILEEIESGKKRITEIEKKYFEAFWNLLSAEQRAKFSELNR